MAQLRELKGRIKAVGNIKRITNTMQMIATAKFQAAARRATQTKPYTRKIAELVSEVAAATGGEADHPLLRAPVTKQGRELLLVITSNRGLCGAYNANVLRLTAHFIREHADTKLDLQVVGKKGAAFCRFRHYAVEAAHTHIGDKPKYEDVEALADEYIQRFVAGRYDAVRAAYVQFISNSRQTPTIQTILPMQQPAAEGGRVASVVYEFSPDPQAILAELLPVAVKAQLFQAFNDAVVSEQVARMVAMKSATDNAEDMGRNLKRSFNRARQARITTELTEIVSGAAALS